MAEWPIPFDFKVQCPVPDLGKVLLNCTDIWFDSQGQVRSGCAKHSDLAASVNYRKNGFFRESQGEKIHISKRFNLLLVDE